MKRALCILLVFICMMITAVSASAVDYGCQVETVSKAVWLENLDTGAVIYTKSADQQMYPASTTKIMTYVIVADNVSDFDGTTAVIKEDVISGIDPESTVMGLKDHIGEEYSIRDLLYGMMLPSGNDAALVLADYVGGGSIPAFVEMMNAKAEELGCTGTHFVNPHGLFDTGHYTTARDLATITKYARTTQSFMDITNTWSYTPARFSQPITNTNYMLSSTEHGGAYYYPNVRGVKTGYLDEAGKCLVTTAEKDGFTYLCVALGADYSFTEDVNYAMKDTANLYDWVFENLLKQTVYGVDDVLKTVSVSGGKGEDKLNLVPDTELSALLPKDYDKSQLRVDFECPDSVEAPVGKGQVIGKATVYYGDLMVGSANLTAANSIEQNQVKAIFSGGSGSWLSSHWLLIVLIAAFFLVLIILLIVVSASARKKQARQRAAAARRRYRD